MRQKSILLLLLCAMLLGILSAAQAYDPISTAMELSKREFTGPDDVTVSIRISNVGDDRMPGPVYLYYPDGKIVTGFGDGGAATLEIGGFATWEGKWRVTQRQLEDGKISFQVKYPVPNENGDITHKSKYFSNTIVFKGAAPGLKVTRVISPAMARKGQNVTITYDLSNTGNVSLNNIEITENRSISTKKATIKSLGANDSQQVKFEVTMGTKNLVSGATITYKAAGSSETSKYVEEDKTIALGEADLNATLTSSAAGVHIGETVKLTLTLKNEGNISYSNLRVTDLVLGEVFSNLVLDAGKTMTLEKEVKMMANGEYAFTIQATDNTGTEVSVTTGKVTVSAVDPNKKLILTVNATADKLEVYSEPALVRFEVAVTNASETEAKDVVLRHGSTELITFPSIKAGETKKISRDTNISRAGKFQFTASCKDLLENVVTFESNILNIAYAVPTPAPTSAPQRTVPPLQTEPIPTSAGLPSAFTTAKNVSLILFGLFLVLLGGSLLLLFIAFSKRMAQKRQSEAALDHLERGTRRDYTTPSDNDEAEPVSYRDDDENPEGQEADPLFTLQDEELPHMKYVRGENTKESDIPSTDQPEDGPKAEEAYRELTEEEAAILSGGTGHYRLARSTGPKAHDEEPAAVTGHTTRHRRTAKLGTGNEKPADM